MPPPNLTIDTAIDLGPFPATVMQDVFVSPVPQTVFYKFTAVRTGVVGLLALGNLTTYRPILTVLLGPVDSPTNYPSVFGTAMDAAVQIPVDVGVTYYLELDPDVGDSADPANLTLNAQWAPAQPAPVGSLLITDDTPPYPAALVDPLTGAVLQFLYPFPAGESAEVLPTSGVSMVEDFANSQVLVYAADLATVVATIPLVTGGAHPALSSDQVDTFYEGLASGGGAVTVHTYNAAGVLQNTYTIAGSAHVTALAPNVAETVLYLTGRVNNLSSTISAWDLVNHVFLADFAAALTNYQAPADVLVLGDGTIAIAYYKQSPSIDVTVKVYSAVGAVLVSKSYGAAMETSTPPRMWHAIDDPNSFWLWLHNDDGTSTIRNVKASDLSDVTTPFTVAVFEQGVNQTMASLTPTRFGYSSSCPGLVSRQLIPGGCVPSLITGVS